MSFMINNYLVYVDSRKRLSGTDSNFFYNIAFPPDHSFTHMVCLNALIPKSYMLVQKGYNTFQLKENTTTVTVTVPVGNYLLNAFKTTIGTVLTAASPNLLTYTLAYPSTTGADTGKWTYTQNNGSIVSSLIFNSVFFEPFGFLQNSTNIFTATTLTSSAVIKLQSEDRLLIHCDQVNNNSNNDILVSINAATNVNFSSIAYINYHPEFNSHALKSDHNNTFSFQLTDENNIVLDTNGLNINMTLCFYKKDPIYDQLRELMKTLLPNK